LQLVKKFPAFHETRRFVTALTSVRHLSLSWASPIQSIYPHPHIVSPAQLRVIKSRRIRWAGHVAHMGEERGVYKVLVRKLEGKRPVGGSRRRWVDNIRKYYNVYVTKIF